ncbi:pilus assembly protein PilP [Corticibacter populi]|uniref:Pilus assembly protein PilP n=2 Tax=Corticibacter populi TaxID=1550736 RepID=A0A3M6QV82_9BURK|nr:pilus assembly protein PilP [Corticibacter populi]
MYPTRTAVAVMMACLLSACADSRQSEVSAWMTREKSQAAPSIKPLPEPSVFQPVAYDRDSALDPFDFQKLAQVFESGTMRRGDTSLIDMHRARRKEPLEAYPLDTIRMVGFMQQHGKPTALVSVDNHLYQVTAGQYLGQNYGLIQSVSEARMQLKEIVQDAAGEWVERSTVVELQE